MAKCFSMTRRILLVDYILLKCLFPSPSQFCESLLWAKYCLVKLNTVCYNPQKPRPPFSRTYCGSRPGK